jgi:hypothetical protein
LVGYRNDYAAYVAYKMRMHPISLVVTSEVVAQPSGGEEIVSKGLTFHYDSIQGLKVITWSDRALTYALVSDLEERGQQSCLVCHQGTRDQDFIEDLKPKQVSGRLIVPLRARDASQYLRIHSNSASTEQILICSSFSDDGKTQQRIKPSYEKVNHRFQLEG